MRPGYVSSHYPMGVRCGARNYRSNRRVSGPTSPTCRSPGTSTGHGEIRKPANRTDLAPIGEHEPANSGGRLRIISRIIWQPNSRLLRRSAGPFR